MEIMRTPEEIRDVLAEAANHTINGKGLMSLRLYSLGVDAAIKWLSGSTEEDPFQSWKPPQQ